MPPSRRLVGAVRILAPTDATALGTWVGVNQHGVAATLLNRYADAADLPTPGTVSRGLLVHSVLMARSAPELIDRVRRASLGRHQPFTIVAIDSRHRCLIGDWDAREFEVDRGPEVGLVRTSSGRDQAEAERSRAAAFADLAKDQRPSAALLAAFHRGHWPARGPFSVCMHREEAATRSLTVVRLRPTRATMWYWDGPPCHRPRVARRTLTRSR